jgi:hypothetical protein
MLNDALSRPPLTVAARVPEGILVNDPVTEQLELTAPPPPPFKVAVLPFSKRFTAIVSVPSSVSISDRVVPDEPAVARLRSREAVGV